VSRSENDIKAPDGFLLGGLRRVAKDGTILFQRGYWQAPIEWAGEKVWVHELWQSCGGFGGEKLFLEAAQPGLHIYEARCMKPQPYTVVCERTERPDAKPGYRNATHIAWHNRDRTP